MIFRSCLTSVLSLPPRTTTMWKCGRPRRKCQGGAREASGVDLLWSLLNKNTSSLRFLQRLSRIRGGWVVEGASGLISLFPKAGQVPARTGTLQWSALEPSPNISTPHENICPCGHMALLIIVLLNCKTQIVILGIFAHWWTLCNSHPVQLQSSIF